MSEAKPTPGPWVVERGDGDEWYFSGGEIVLRPDGKKFESIAVIGASAQAEADFKLFADAGTVFHTTGLTPSQLVERVKELEEALRKYEDVREDMFGFFLSNGIFNQWGKRYDYSALNNAHLQASAALSKARPNTAEGEATASDTDGTRWNQTPCEHCGHTEGEHFNARCLHITGETRYTPAAAKEPSP